VIVEAANSSVNKALELQKERKRGAYTAYSSSTRAKIGKFAAENGNKAAVAKFTKELGKPVNESTVRSLKTCYLNALKSTGNESVSTLEHGNRGRPLHLGAIDRDVIDYVKKLRAAGGIVNKSIIIAAATGIVKHKRPSLLRENGGGIEIGRGWAQNLMLRMGFVKRKGTKAARQLPADISAVKEEFLQRVQKVVQAENIPSELVINFDQTGCKFVPAAEWTMSDEGAHQVPIFGLGDKREMTVLLSVTMSGIALPPQLIYAGKTDRCHASTAFPDQWDVTHTESHWSNETTMCRYADNILIPYVTSVRQQLSRPEQAALAIFDVFRAHRSESFLKKLNDANIRQVFIPGGCTGELQPLDLTVNQAFKTMMKARFSAWYAEKVKDKLNSQDDEVVELQIGVIKPLHGVWLMDAIAALEKELIIKGFEQAGLK
jgi:hypothetical protein